MSCSRDKDIFVLRAGRGVNESNKNRDKERYMPYNHWENWKSFTPIRGYIHFGLTNSLVGWKLAPGAVVGEPFEVNSTFTSKDYQEFLRKFRLKYGDNVEDEDNLISLELSKLDVHMDDLKLAMEEDEKYDYQYKQFDRFYEMSKNIGNNVIIIEPNTNVWSKQNRIPNMNQKFVFIGKTTSNLKQEIVNFGEYDDTEFENENGNHSNYVELEGHIFNESLRTSKANYRKYFGRYVDDDTRFSCYKYDKSEIKEEYWNKLDALYNQ